MILYKKYKVPSKVFKVIYQGSANCQLFNSFEEALTSRNLPTSKCNFTGDLHKRPEQSFERSGGGKLRQRNILLLSLSHASLWEHRRTSPPRNSTGKMVFPRVATPPLRPPMQPEMVRSTEDTPTDGQLDRTLARVGALSDDEYADSASRPLLGTSPTHDKAERVREIVAAAQDGEYLRSLPKIDVRPHAVYGPDDNEPSPPQAYPNSLNIDRRCVCHTTPLASALCWLGLPCCCIPLCGTCVTVYPRNAVVTTVYGQFFHNFTKPGLYFINPCGREAQVVSLKSTSVGKTVAKVTFLLYSNNSTATVVMSRHYHSGRATGGEGC